MSDRHVLPPYSLRMTAELREMLESAAKKKKRSLNAEIITRLECTELLDREMRNRTDGDYDYSDVLSWIASLESENREHLEELEEYRRNPTVLEGADIVQAIMAKISSRQMGLLDALVFEQRFMRLRRPGSTHEAIDQLLTCIATLNRIQSVVLAVRDGDANHSALSVVIKTDQLTLVSDETLLTVERPPRESEVRDFIQSLDSLGLLDGPTRFQTLRVTPSNHLSAEAASKALESGELKPLGLETLQEFLALFHPKPVRYEKHELLQFLANEQVSRN